MAVITKLRNSGWVVIVVIVALILFVVSDLLTSSGSTSGPADNSIAVMNGVKVSIDEFNQLNAENEKNYMQNTGQKELNDQIREYIRGVTWGQLVQKYVTEEEYRRAGLNIGEEEWTELLLGKNPHQLVKQYFSDEKGGFNPKTVRDFLNNQYQNSPLAQEFMNNLKRQIESEVLRERYLNYLSKCNYYTKTYLKQDYISSNRTVNGKVVTLSLNTIPDKDIKVTDEDLEAYLREHKEEYKQEESRDLEFVVWDINPTSADTAENLRAALTVADNFRANKPDTNDSRVENKWVAPGTMPAAIENSIIGAPEGEVVGPVYNDGAFYVYVKVAQMADTLTRYNVSQITIAPNASSIPDSAAAKKLAGELLVKARAGEDFAKLAAANSTDYASSSNGGALGWRTSNEISNQYGPAFEKAVAALSSGGITLVRGNSGAWHIIKALSAPNNQVYKFASSKQQITPGSKTIDSVSRISGQFRAGLNEEDEKSFEKQIEKLNLNPRVAKDLKPGDRGVPGAESASEVVRWAFDEETAEGSVSPVFNSGSRQIVARLTTLKKEGYARVKDVRERIEPLVRNEKKGEKLKEKMEAAMKGVKTMEELAIKLQTIAQPVENQNFSNGALPFVGSDQRIIGALFGLKEKVMSKPIVGMTGVTVIYLDKVNNVEAPKTGLESRRMMLDMQNSSQQIEGKLTEAMRKMAGIKDYRYKFF
jgi:peptidyl-prolyl cis-trans isomerase D